MSKLTRIVADVRDAVRMLANSPGFALVAIISLALGIGANSAAFSYVDAMLLRPLPVHDSASIIGVSSTAPGTRLGSMSYPDFVDLRAATKALSSLVAYSVTPIAYSANRDAPPRFNLGMMVSGNFFSGLGIEIPVGRSFLPDEDSVNGKDSVAVISYSMWERDYGGSPTAIGRQIRVNGSDFTVIGVAPEGFTGPEAFLLPEVYIPMHSFQQAIPAAKADYLTARDNRRFTLLGRLAAGASERQAEAELSTIARQLAADYPDTNKNRTVTALSYIRARYENDPEDAQFALGILSITALVLLIACANVASLCISRGTARTQEIAIRMAIGAGRATLVRQLLTESLVLAILGGTAGLAVGYAGVSFLNSIEVPSDFPIAFDARMDQRMLWFSLLASIATGIVFGLWPALRATRADLISTIKASDQGPIKGSIFRGKFIARNVLMVAQLTLSVVLLSFSGYFVRGFQTAQRTDWGMRTDHTLFFTLDPAALRYDEAKTRQFYKELKDRLKQLPGVRAVSLSSSIPFSTGQSDRPMVADGYSLRPGENAPVGWTYTIDEDYFPLMEIPLLRGRVFDASDTANSPKVVIINEYAAKRLFPNRDALGARLRIDSADGLEVQIVGIARTTKYVFWSEPVQMAMWVPSSQDYNSSQVVELRTSGDPAALAPAVRSRMHELNPDLALKRLSTMENLFDKRVLLGPRLIAQIATATGLAGLLLAVIGLYSVVAYSVSRRTREIGIRMAIGARPADILRMVFRQGIVFTSIGLAIGLAIAIPVLHGDFFKFFATGVNPFDPLILFDIPAALAAVMTTACVIPARRASRVDPTRTMRIE